MKLVNVRLSDEDAGKVAELRQQGVELSELVREAVRARHLALRPRLEPGDVRGLLAAIYARHPLTRREERAQVDATKRRDANAFIRRKLVRHARP